MDYLYRYRNDSVLSHKEILYNEVYFAANDELNDPFDTRLFINIDMGVEFYHGRIVEALFRVKGQHKSTTIDSIAELLQRRVKSYKNLMSLLDGPLYEHFDNEEDGKRACQFLKEDLASRIPIKIHTCSFSANADSILMWSHYTKNHHGFVLVFCPRNGKLYRDSGDPESISSSFDQGFQFRKVVYSTEGVSVDGGLFYSRPKDGLDRNSDFENFKREIQRSYITKATEWSYESEYRLIFEDQYFDKDPPFQVDRTVRFDPTQLVGIILGERISETSKKELVHLVKKARTSVKERKGLKQLPPFQFQQASMSTDGFRLENKTFEIID